MRFCNDSPPKPLRCRAAALAHVVSAARQPCSNRYRWATCQPDPGVRRTAQMGFSRLSGAAPSSVAPGGIRSLRQPLMAAHRRRGATYSTNGWQGARAYQRKHIGRLQLRVYALGATKDHETLGARHGMPGSGSPCQIVDQPLRHVCPSPIARRCETVWMMGRSRRRCRNSTGRCSPVPAHASSVRMRHHGDGGVGAVVKATRAAAAMFGIDHGHGLARTARPQRRQRQQCKGQAQQRRRWSARWHQPAGV